MLKVEIPSDILVEAIESVVSQEALLPLRIILEGAKIPRGAVCAIREAWEEKCEKHDKSGLFSDI